MFGGERDARAQGRRAERHLRGAIRGKGAIFWSDPDFEIVQRGAPQVGFQGAGSPPWRRRVSALDRPREGRGAGIANGGDAGRRRRARQNQRAVKFASGRLAAGVDGRLSIAD